MLTRAEIVPYGVTLNEAQDASVNKLLAVMNVIRAEYGLLMRVTSGFRTHEMEMRIDPMHPNSLHTVGAAVDIYDPDPDRRLWNWCIGHMDLLVELGVYLEDRLYSHNHVHFQIWPPASGTRIFRP